MTAFNACSTTATAANGRQNSVQQQLNPGGGKCTFDQPPTRFKLGQPFESVVFDALSLRSCSARRINHFLQTLQNNRQLQCGFVNGSGGGFCISCKMEAQPFSIEASTPPPNSSFITNRDQSHKRASSSFLANTSMVAAVKPGAGSGAEKTSIQHKQPTTRSEIEDERISFNKMTIRSQCSSKAKRAKRAKMARAPFNRITLTFRTLGKRRDQCAIPCHHHLFGHATHLVGGAVSENLSPQPVRRRDHHLSRLVLQNKRLKAQVAQIAENRHTPLTGRAVRQQIGHGDENSLANRNDAVPKQREKLPKTCAPLSSGLCAETTHRDTKHSSTEEDIRCWQQSRPAIQPNPK